MASVKITFIGHASFRFESDKGSVTYFDAWLDDNPTAKMKLSQVRKADIVIATHGHSDHIGDSYEICKRTKAKFVGNYELCSVAEAVHGLKMGSRSLSLNPGGGTKVKDATITMVQAHHSQSLSPHVIGGELPEGLLFHPDSAVNGLSLPTTTASPSTTPPTPVCSAICSSSARCTDRRSRLCQWAGSTPWGSARQRGRRA